MKYHGTSHFKVERCYREGMTHELPPLQGVPRFDLLACVHMHYMPGRFDKTPEASLSAYADFARSTQSS